GGSGRDATMITTFKQKVEELRAKPPDSEKAEHTTTPPSSKKVCGHYEKQMQNMFEKPDDGLPCVEDFLGTFESMLFGTSMEERVADIVKDFHGTPGLQSKHRLDKEKLDAVINIMSGTNQASREVIRVHCDRHRWKECAFSTEQLKSQRWLLGATPKGSTCPADLKKALTVTDEAQTLHLQLTVHSFLENGRRLRPSARPRVRWSPSTFESHSDFSCIYAAVLREARGLASFSAEKEKAIMKAFFDKDYYSDIEAVVTSRLASWKVQHLGLWTDVVEPHAAPMSIPTAADLMEIEDESQAAKFREIRAKVAQDVAAMTQYNASVQEHTRRLHVVKVMHEKSQVEAGKQLCEGHMEKLCRVSLLDKSMIDPKVEASYRQAAASAKVSVGDVHTVLYVDCSKLGVLQQQEINVIGELADRYLSRSPTMFRHLCFASGPSQSHTRFCQSPLWLRQGLPPDQFPAALNEKDFVIPTPLDHPGLSHDARRNLTDLQETSQWLGGISIPKAILQQLFSGVRGQHAGLVVHATSYDGAVKIAALQLGYPCVGVSANEAYHKTSKQIVKQHLLQAWKNGQPPMNNVTPRYRKDVVQDELPRLEEKPQFKVCQLTPDGKFQLPQDVRGHFMQDPIWGPEWREIVTKFDQQWGSVQTTTDTNALSSSPAATPSPGVKTEAQVKNEVKLEADGFSWSSHFSGEPESEDSLKTKFGSDLTEIPGGQNYKFFMAPGPNLCGSY
ncbi:Uncharacterized protein SCF082_LOCUS32081, partial [Durusdinium trenchii]